MDIATQWGNRRWSEFRDRIDRYTFPCVKQIAGGDMLISTGNSEWGSVMT